MGNFFPTNTSKYGNSINRKMYRQNSCTQHFSGFRFFLDLNRTGGINFNKESIKNIVLHET